MSAIAEVLEDGETLEFSIDVPEPGDKSVRCQTCGAESYLHYLYKDDFMSFCNHHGRKSHDRLIELGGVLVADYSELLLEKS